MWNLFDSQGGETNTKAKSNNQSKQVKWEKKGDC